MRNLFILRGTPSSGKSTWVKENNLEPYTLSTDSIRLLFQSPVTKEDGSRVISQNNDNAVWSMLFEMLEKRMAKGEFTVIDATHYKSSLISRYKNLVEKYRYRVNVINFEIPEEECLKRNKERETYKQVPEDVIKKMYACIHDDSEVKKAYKILTPEEASEFLKTPLKPANVESEKVIVFGDIHGCYEPLKEYFEKNPFNSNYCYIFCGDYLDRGIQNKEVLEFLLRIYKEPNVFLLEGNHEAWLRIYSDKGYNPIKPKKEYTDFYVVKIIEQLEDKKKQFKNKISKEEIRFKELCKIDTSESDEVFFEFSKVSSSELKEKMLEDIRKMKSYVNKLQEYIYVLNHEQENTKSCIEKLSEWYSVFGEGIALNPKSLISKTLNMEEIKEDNPIRSSEFIQNTLPQIESIPREQIRQLCRKFIQTSYFDFCGARFLVTHGGVPCLPDIFTPTQELIKGVGKYDDHELIDKTFNEKTPYWLWQIHGHRNTMKVPTYDGKRTFNLEGEVEFGGCLRIVELEKTDDSWKHNTIEIKNSLFKQEELKTEEKSDIETLKEMLTSPLINIRELDDNICSFNFNKDAFYNDKWNNLTCKARGLFVDKTNGNIAARSFDKFFNYLQVKETKPSYLKEHLKFPLVGYKKENGFLGIVSKYNDKVRFFTKSSDQGDFVNWFIGCFCDNYGINQATEWSNNGFVSYSELYNSKDKSIFSTDIVSCLNDLRQRLADKLYPLLTEGYSYVFECVDKDNDPHIIEYDKNNVYLLEVFKNQLKEECVSWENLISISDTLNVPLKQRELELDNWEEFEEWVRCFQKADIKHEGFVLEDNNGFRVKFKSNFYSFWKQMRSLKERLERGHENKKIYKTKQEIEVVKLIEKIPREELQNMSIIDVRNIFYQHKL